MEGMPVVRQPCAFLTRQLYRVAGLGLVVAASSDPSAASSGEAAAANLGELFAGEVRLVEGFLEGVSAQPGFGVIAFQVGNV
jgi:hypothetical protein